MTARILLVALTMFFAVGAAAAPVADDLQAAVDGFLADNPTVPGVVVHVICPPLGLDRSFTAGAEDRDSEVPLTADHVVRIASNTKTYVAAAVLRLAEQGKLRLDDPLGQHLDAETHRLLKEDGYDLEAITIEQVLAHTSGLFEHPADPRYAEAITADPFHPWTREEQIARCVEWGDPVGEPGERFSYSDTGLHHPRRHHRASHGPQPRPGRPRPARLRGVEARCDWWEILEEAPADAGPRAHQYYYEQDATTWHPRHGPVRRGRLITAPATWPPTCASCSRAACCATTPRWAP